MRRWSASPNLSSLGDCLQRGDGAQRVLDSMNFYINLSAYLMNIYLFCFVCLFFLCKAAMGTPSYIRINTFRPCFMMLCQKHCVTYQHSAGGERIPQQLCAVGGVGWDGVVLWDPAVLGAAEHPGAGQPRSHHSQGEVSSSGGFASCLGIQEGPALCLEGWDSLHSHLSSWHRPKTVSWDV